MPSSQTLPQFLTLLMGIGLVAGTVSEAFGQDDPIRVLILTGNDYPGHKWKETTPVVRGILSAQKHLDVYVSEDIEILASSPEERYDVMVMHWCNWKTPMPSQAAKDGLVKYMEAGKGLVVLHFACGGFWDWTGSEANGALGWPEYEKIIGRVWDTAKTHDPYQAFTVKVTDHEHPITQGLKDFETTDELYFCLTGAPKIDVLMTARSVRTEKDEPMGFVLNYKSGRVFHTPLGHDVKAMQAPGLAPLLQRACEWAATGKVTRYKP